MVRMSGIASHKPSLMLLWNLGQVSTQKDVRHHSPWGNANWNHHFTPTRMAVNKKIDSNKYWQEGGEIRTLLHCWWECKTVQLLRESLAVPQKLKHRVTVRPSNSTPRSILKRTENICSYKGLHRNVHSRNTHFSQKVQTIPMFIHWWMDKQNVTYIFAYYLVIKKNEELTHNATRIKLHKSIC